LTDIIALDGRGYLGLSVEALHEVGLHGRPREEHLDGDLPPVLVALGRPYLAHTPASEQSRYSVTRQDVAGVDRHVTWISTVPGVSLERKDKLAREDIERIRGGRLGADPGDPFNAF